jgi:hypothetical protein
VVPYAVKQVLTDLKEAFFHFSCDEFFSFLEREGGFLLIGYYHSETGVKVKILELVWVEKLRILCTGILEEVCIL